MVLLGAFACSSFAADEPKKAPPTKEQLTRLVRDLGNDDFEKREHASKRLWEAGRLAEALLKEALNSEDVEVKHRSGELLDKLKWGIYPDTPAKIVEMIQCFRAGANADAKGVIIRELLDAGEEGRTAFAKIKAAQAKVAYMDLKLKVVVDGDLEAKNEHAVKCEVKPSGRGGHMVKWVVENHRQVKKGDLILEIDDSRLQGLVLPMTMERLTAQAHLIAAEAIFLIKKHGLRLARLQARPADVRLAEFELKTAESTLETAWTVWQKREALYKDLLEQVRKCKVYAPFSGQIQYTTFNSRVGVWVVAEGEPVVYGLKMMSIPDLSTMRVRVRIHEAVINHMKKGLRATVRVDALAGEILPGKVIWVAAVASPADWMSPDAKVYECLVEIEGNLASKHLMPGLSAVCTIVTDLRSEHVLAIPLCAVMVPPEREKPRCLVITPHGLEERQVELGLGDGRMVEIKAGLKAGETVVEDYSGPAIATP